MSFVTGAIDTDLRLREAPATDFRRLGRNALGFVLPLGLLALYEIAFRAGWVEARLLPPPSRIFATLYDLAVTGELLRHVVATILRVAAGFGLGAAIGVILGALSGSVPLVCRLIDPTIQALRAIPSLAWVPLFILWLGIFETPKIMLIAVGVFFPVYLGVMGSILSVDRKLVEVGRAFRLKRLALVRRILLPAILPAIVVALRTGLGLGFMFVVAAEIMGASEGLGYLLVDGQQLGKPDQILAAVIAFAIVGKLADGLLASATRPLLRWQDAFAPQPESPGSGSRQAGSGRKEDSMRNGILTYMGGLSERLGSYFQTWGIGPC